MPRMFLAVITGAWLMAAAGTASSTQSELKQSPPGVRGHLRAEDGQLVYADDGAPFSWRGISAFRLLEMVATDREADADAYLAWARSHGLTVVRVFTMVKQI